jgi:large subunit ribosomal protein L21
MMFMKWSMNIFPLISNAISANLVQSVRSRRNQMYAIIKSGGKQYRVKEGDVIDVELLEGEPGASIHFGEVLFVSDGSKAEVGSPVVSGFEVIGELIGESKGEKITSIKYIPGNHYRKFGHRQRYSRVKITTVGHKGKKGGKHGT